ncbi:early transcribed membrane protein [Plasmodium ovale]|uniref:Early transcribed membrane protein n=1 Tax=Plasmodium ovale TaxID=36330 RepID=A0A1C3KWL0_PLAOA|nr:early transcribed membrane protein [Plasmodium ovale]
MKKKTKNPFLFIFIFSLVIIPHTFAHVNTAIKQLNFETLQENEKIKLKGKKDEIIIMSLVCGSVLFALTLLWGIRIHRIRIMDKEKNITDEEHIRVMSKKGMCFDNRAYDMEPGGDI